MAESTRGRKAASAKPKKPAARREFVTLTPFQWWQIDSLMGIYAPTAPEVLRRIVLDWLAIKHDEIEKQKQEHAQFLRETTRNTESQ